MSDWGNTRITKESEGEKHMNEEMLCACAAYIYRRVRLNAVRKNEWSISRVESERANPDDSNSFTTFFSDISNIFYFGISTHISVCALNLRPDGKL